MKNIAFVFPGQGSQSLHMLADVADSFPEIKKIFNEASNILNYDLWKLTQEGPAEELDKTIHTQPALLAASYALWQTVQSRKNIHPKFLAGHSLGEYTALVCGGAMSFKDAIKLVSLRGQFMQEAVPAGTGALAAVIGLDDTTLESICKKSVLANEVLSPANFNSRGQTVIAGSSSAVQRALILCKESGAKLVKLLPVSVPSHCALMKPAAERLAETLKTISFQPLTIPVINNVDVKEYTDGKNICDGLIRQLYSPVRWYETIEYMVKHGVTDVIECGPGKILNGLNKRIATELQLSNVHDLQHLEEVLH